MRQQRSGEAGSRIEVGRWKEGITSMPKRHPNTRREGGPGASHENRKEPRKSKPHADLNRHHPEQGNTRRNAAGKSGGDGREHS
jgi:hypothetical protein